MLILISIYFYKAGCSSLLKVKWKKMYSFEKQARDLLSLAVVVYMKTDQSGHRKLPEKLATVSSLVLLKERVMNHTMCLKHVKHKSGTMRLTLRLTFNGVISFEALSIYKISESKAQSK